MEKIYADTEVEFENLFYAYADSIIESLIENTETDEIYKVGTRK